MNILSDKRFNSDQRLFFCANDMTGTILMTEKLAGTIIPLYDDLAGAEG
jgi:hypothetical protein